MVGLRVPVATYRLQFNRRFRFADAQALVPYLHQMGITDIYASPIFKARRGSTHGYDVTDPTRLNPELGSNEEFKGLVQELKRYRMGLLLDIVPNHMAASSQNEWWLDVLENGPSSRYASYFDIDWQPEPASEVLDNTLLLPILGGPYRSVLENRELILDLDEEGLFVRYHAVRLPLDPKSYRILLTYRLEDLKQALGQGHQAFQELVDLVATIERLPGRTAADAQEVEARRKDKEVIKERLWRLYNTSPQIRKFIDENVSIFNGQAKDQKGLHLLDQLLADQAYRLAFWREGIERINYRRFFDISDLIGIRVEDPEVFEAVHALAFRLADEGKVTGLRIDHIDGLHDPLDYLRQLQDRLRAKKPVGATPRFYVVVEKILSGDEELPEDWPVCGTTGYDFLIALNTVFVDAQGVKLLDTTYKRFTRAQLSSGDVVYESKKRVMQDLFVAELRVLGHHLGRLSQEHHSRGLSLEELTQALVEVTACLSVYRTYVRGFEVPPRDRSYIEGAINEARRRSAKVRGAALDFLRRVLTLDLLASSSAQQREHWRRFVMRWQQFTGSVMAKGLEDTALYRHNQLVSLNEVGCGAEGTDPSAGIERFHRHNQRTLQRWPWAMNATSTHDTKRSEDVRARLNVLSELPRTWARSLGRWGRMNQDKKGLVNGQSVPDPNEEVLFYQSLLGAWPLEAAEVLAFQERLKAYMVKAAREAKVHTSWLHPDEAYENALAGFLDTCLDTSSPNDFLDDFLPFQQRVAYYGAVNSLSQVLLKVTSPGIPDFYQGAELWDFSLVDPDNRRPVDFSRRAQMLSELKRLEAGDPAQLVRELLAAWRDGRIKMYVILKALGFRSTHAKLFQEGAYTPLPVSGGRMEHVVAFARREGGNWALVAVPRLATSLCAPNQTPAGRRTWRDTAIALPAKAPRRWVNVLTGESLRTFGSSENGAIHLRDAFRHFPAALLIGTGK
ncbi:MAG: malto-oligosyltrehalose synthase [Dehalococcoidia bacterium]|nr:MAG: malto-oligosyltrehalose synthase [Dehalococcoidia bacterium]